MAYRQFGPLEAMMHVQQQGEMGRQRGEQTRLGRLVSQGMSEPGGLMKIAPEVAKIDPNAAFAMQDRESANLDKRRELLTGRARILSAMPTQQRAQVWPSIKAELAAVDPELGAALPDMYDEAQFGPVIEQLANLGGGGATGVQSTYVDAQGNRVAIMRNGSTQILGQNDPGMSNQTISIPGPDGRPRQYTFNKRTGQYEPAGGGMPSGGAPMPAQGQSTPFREFTVNNDGEVPFPTDPAEQEAALRAMREGGTFAVQGGQVSPAAPRVAPAAGNPFVGRTPEEEAAAVEAAKRSTGLQFAGQEAEAEANKARLKKEAEAQADRVINAPGAIQKATETVALIDLALKHPGRETATGASGVLDPRNYWPGSNATDFRVVLDQLGGRAFLEAFESLKGGGQITEVEGRKATEAMARLNRAQSDEAFEAALRELRDIAIAAQTRAQQAAPQQASGQPPSGQYSEMSDEEIKQALGL